MSPRVDPATALPPPKPRRQDPLSRMIAEALDHQLLCCAEKDESFTTYEIRDQLLKRPELEDVDPNLLRLRVRDRLKTLQKLDLVIRVGVRGKNRGLYRMQLGMPIEPSASTPSSSTTPPVPSSTPPVSPLLNHLQQNRERLTIEMRATIREAECYRDLIEAFPDARSQIAPLLEAAIEHSGRLKGEWDANLKLRQHLDSGGNPEISGSQEDRS